MTARPPCAVITSPVTSARRKTNTVSRLAAMCLLTLGECCCGHRVEIHAECSPTGKLSRLCRANLSPIRMMSESTVCASSGRVPMSPEMKCYRCLRNRLRRSVMSRNARPEPVLRYCSNAAALSAFANVVNATSVQGRRCAVCFEPPLLCTAKRLPLVEAHATEDAKQAASRTRPICTKVKIEYARTSALAVDGCGKE